MAIKGKQKEITEIIEKEVDKRKLNEVVELSRKFLKVALLLLVLGGIYSVLMIGKELDFFNFIKTFFKIISPLFIGVAVAWLFDPVVRIFEKKGLKRKPAAAIVYLIFAIIIVIIIWAIVPMLSTEINNFVKTLPQVFDAIKNWISNIFDKFGNIESFDANLMKTNIFKKIEEFALNLTSSLPELTVNFIKSFFSGLGTILIGLVIGFFLLISYNDTTETILGLIPEKFHKDTRDLVKEINVSLRSFVEGALLDCTAVFLISSLGLWLVGVKSPLLFGLFCGITNIIPYAGPYIGGAPAVIVGFVQSPLTGFLALIVIALIQAIEGNFFQPIIMSKTTKLNPITIMLGLLVFGHFWGIIGMVVSTPILASSKVILKYIDNKYDLLKFN